MKSHRPCPFKRSDPTHTPNVLVMHPSVPVRTVKEFIDYVKASPGKCNRGEVAKWTRVVTDANLPKP
jgi:tripartite-type tricarboxylate transporter receptor subunit TctC